MNPSPVLRLALSFSRLVRTLGLLLLGGLYYLGVTVLGWAIPCPIYSITSCQCPACGVTRLFVRLVQGDWRGAFEANAGVFLLSPLLLFVLVSDWWRWLRCDTSREHALLTTLRMLAIVLLLAWGLARNLW